MLKFFTTCLTLLLSFSLVAEAADWRMKYRGFNMLKTPVDTRGFDFITPQGDIQNVTEWRGNWVLLNAWASWCAPCIAELPDLAQLARNNPFPNLQIKAVSFDQKRTQAELIDILARRNLGNFAAYMDIDRVFEKALKANGLPRTYLINPDGFIVADYRGAANWLDPKVFQDLSLFVNSGTTSNKSATSP